MDRIEALLTQLRDIDTGGPPVLTVSLDLSPGTDGIPSAPHVVKQGWRWVEERFPALEHDALRSYQKDQRAVEALLNEAIARGSQGLYYVGCAETGLQQTLETPYALRNSTYLAQRPWIFELLRYQYLVHRPITVALVDLASIHAMRVQYGDIEEEVEAEHWQGAARGAHGRTDTQGRGSAGTDPGGAAAGAGRSGQATAADAAGGWHGKSRIEKSILAHKEAYAREDAERLVELVEGEDILIIAGPEEARSELLRQLPDGLRARAIEARNVNPNVGEDEIANMATHVVIEEQYAHAEREFERWRSGDLGERAIAGVEGLRKAIERGQLGTLLVPEDAVSHLGVANDARAHEGRVPSAVIDELVNGARDVSADILILRAGTELANDEIPGMLRWS